MFAMPQRYCHVHVLLVFSLMTCAWLTACEKAPQPEQHTASAQDSVSTPASINVLDELKHQPTKKFATTAQDAADIAALTQFEQNFSAQSEQMEIELEKLAQQSQLKPDAAIERKYHNLQNGLKQLNALNLKTEQGRYIQVLWQQYWQNQQRVLNQQVYTSQQMPSATTLGNNVGLSTYLQAQQQLKEWQAKQP